MSINEDPAVDVVVIGAGIAGLAAARVLRHAGLTVTVLEREDRVGGRAITERIDGSSVDLGAQFISKFYDATISLIQDIGLSPLLVQRSQKAFLMVRQSEQGLWPAGDLITGHAISPFSKARLLLLAIPLLRHWRRLDIANLPASASFDRLSAATYLRRLVGQQNLDNFFAPLLRGLLYWDTDTTGIAIVLAILKAFATRSGTYRLDGGISRFPEALTNGVDVRTGVAVQSLTVSGDGYLVTAVAQDRIQQVHAKAVLCATTATQVLPMMPWLPTAMADFLKSVTYTRTAILTFRARLNVEDYPQGALLFPVPGVRDVASVNPLYQVVDGPLKATSKDADGSTLINVFLSDQGVAHFGDLDDHDLGVAMAKRVSELIGDSGWLAVPSLAHVQRWPEALPRFQPGHIEATEEFHNAEAQLVGLAFAGDYLDGPYIDGAVRSGQNAASRLIAKLNPSSKI